MRRLRRLGVAVVTVQRRELHAAVEGRQRGQLVRAVVLLLAHGAVLRQAVWLAEAVLVHDGV